MSSPEGDFVKVSDECQSLNLFVYLGVADMYNVR